jgi:GNAT superfamily N-acetyltransferase
MAVRPATPDDASAIARVHVAAWTEAYDGLLPPEVLARQDAAERAARWRAMMEGGAEGGHRAAIAVALDGAGEVAGFASCGEARDDALRARGLTGEVSAIYLLRRTQGRGLGRGLMVWAAETLRARGHKGLGLWVLAGNRPARAFYERLGGTIVVGETPCEVAGAPTTEVAYGWPAPAALISASATTSAASANIGVGSSQ